MQGSRQNVTAKYVTATSTGYKAQWTFDRSFLVNRIKLWDDDGILAVTSKVKIRAEGEELYGGLDIPVSALFIKTDDAATTGTVEHSPRVLSFDTPLSVSKDFPLEITFSGDTESFYVMLEGPSKLVTG
jgi:hypothetical protein